MSFRRQTTKREQDLSLDAALKKIQRLLEVRERSRTEILQRFKQDGFEESVAVEALDRATRCGLQSDQRFASSFIRGKLSSGWGLPRIERELKRKGVPVEDIEGYPDAFITTSELDRALSFLEGKAIPEKNAKDKLMRKLVSRGFSFDVARSAVQYYLEEQRIS